VKPVELRAQLAVLTFQHGDAPTLGHEVLGHPAQRSADLLR
jgi:hypothetical protein